MFRAKMSIKKNEKKSKKIVHKLSQKFAPGVMNMVQSKHQQLSPLFVPHSGNDSGYMKQWTQRRMSKKPALFSPENRPPPKIRRNSEKLD